MEEEQKYVFVITDMHKKKDNLGNSTDILSVCMESDSAEKELARLADEKYNELNHTNINAYQVKIDMVCIKVCSKNDWHLFRIRKAPLV